MELTIIQQKIYTVRGQKVMLDFDLAQLYEVETRAVNQSVKRNLNRFPDDFSFRLTEEEWKGLLPDTMISQFVTSSQNKRNAGMTPFAFTEYGIAMLASVLRSDRAAQMNIFIIRAFIALRKHAFRYNEVMGQLELIKDRLGSHDSQLNLIYDAIENLLDEKTEEKKWENREPIGFKK